MFKSTLEFDKGVRDTLVIIRDGQDWEAGRPKSILN